MGCDCISICMKLVEPRFTDSVAAGVHTGAGLHQQSEYEVVSLGACELMCA